MSAFITLKKYVLILAAALAVTVLAAFFMNYALKGPRLGFYFDFLLSRRPALSPPGEILLVDTGEITESGTVIAVLDALIEFDADSLVLEVPVLGFSPVKSGDGGEIRRRLDDEFSLLGRNIRNLFEAIRMGSVSPSEAGRYVGELVELAERGKERLRRTLIEPDTSSVRLEKEAAVFGSVFRAEEALMLRDGAPRRIRPVFPDGTGHAVYNALKKRWTQSDLEHTEYGPVLVVKNGDEETLVPLDLDGEVILERYVAFRRIPLSAFTRYGETDRSLRGLLAAAEERGLYSAVEPEKSPLYLLDYSEALRLDMLENPGEETRRAWKLSREEYVKSLDEFLSGPIETALVSGYEELIAAENLDSRGVERLTVLRDDLIGTFGELRETWEEFSALREELEAEAESSLCIMGPRPGSSGTLAAALISGRCIVPGRSAHILFWSLLAAFLAVACASRLKFAACLLSAPILGAALAFGFSWYFVISGYWLDPLIPAASAFAGILVFWIGSLIVRARGAAFFRRAYGNAAGKPWLKQLIRAGRPLPSARIKARAAVMAVKDPALLAGEDQDDPVKAAAASEKFRKDVSAILKKAGAVILDHERDMVVACFGSPPERVCLNAIREETPYKDDLSAGNGHHPAVKAGGFITELFRLHPDLPWRFGVDFGECLFYWSDISGYTAFGSAAIRSRVLAGLASRYKAAVLITEPVRERLSAPVRKLHSLGREGENKTHFYELLVKTFTGGQAVQ
jgi:class 3 adenylate cyclase